MYGLIWLEDCVHLGSGELVIPKCSYVSIMGDDNIVESKSMYEFQPLDMSEGIEKAREYILQDWKKIIKKIDEDLGTIVDLVFAYRSQYQDFFYARKQCKGRFEMRECHLLWYDAEEAKNCGVCNVGHSGAENIWNMTNQAKKYSRCSQMKSVKGVFKVGSSTKRISNSNKLVKRTDIKYRNDKTSTIDKFLKQWCDKLGYIVHEENGQIYVFTLASSWRFNALARPMNVFIEEYDRGISEYKLAAENVYSPVDALIFIKERDDTLLEKKVNRLNKVFKEEI